MEFENRVAARETALAGYVYVPQGSQTYITAIDIRVADPSNTSIPSRMTNLVRADAYDPAHENVLNLLHFSFEGSKNLQVAYKTATKAGNSHRNAIAEIGLAWADDVVPSGWEQVDYNMGQPPIQTAS